VARPASDISGRLVKAARDRFLEEGVDGASLRAIARDADTSLGMVYYYFPAKDDLFFAVVEDVYANLLTQLEQVLAADLGIEDKVTKTYQIFAALTDDEVKVVRLIVKEAMASSQRLARLFERFSRGHVALLLSMVIQGVHQGELRNDVPPMVLVLSTVVIGLLPQLLTRRLREVGLPVDALFPAPHVLAAELAHIVLHGIASTSTSQLTPLAERRN
jgi:AcrR family transcriptional regulator